MFIPATSFYSNVPVTSSNLIWARPFLLQVAFIPTMALSLAFHGHLLGPVRALKVVAPVGQRRHLTQEDNPEDALVVTGVRVRNALTPAPEMQA